MDPMGTVIGYETGVFGQPCQSVSYAFHIQSLGCPGGKTMKNKGFGHPKTRLFTINNPLKM